MSQKDFLFRAKLINEWESDEDKVPTVIYPEELPVTFGPFTLNLCPNKQAYLDEIFDPSIDHKVDYDFPLSLLYIDMRLTCVDEDNELLLAEEAFQEIEGLLRLFKSGGIYVRRYYQVWEIKGDKAYNIFFINFAPERPDLNMHYLGGYGIDDDILKDFIIFFKNYWTVVHTKKQPIYSALLRFSSSYEGLTLEERMVDLVIALEALFNDGGDSLAFKVALRCSCLVYPPGQSRKKCYDDLIRFYRDRSIILHGHQIKKPYTSDTINGLEEIVRKAILLFLRLDSQGFNINRMEEIDNHLFFDPKPESTEGQNGQNQ